MTLPSPPTAKMEISVEPNIYEPGMGEDGKYIDRTLYPNDFRNGLRCVCGTKTIFINKTAFGQHCKTTMHQNWLQRTNNNRTNYYSENLKLEETIRNQRLIIAKLSVELEHKTRTIEYLASQLSTAAAGGQLTGDLIDLINE